MSSTYIAYFDGGFRQGFMTFGFVVYSPTGEKIHSDGGYLKDIINTTNRAEYIALIKLLEYLSNKGIKNAIINGDSQVVIRHINGQNNIKSKHLKEKFSIVKDLLEQFDFIELLWIPREQNAEADRAAGIDLPEQKRRKKRNGQA